MVSSYVECPRHGFVAVRGLFTGSGQGMLMKGFSVACPKCGLPSAIIEGNYSMDEETDTTVIQPIDALGVAQLQRLRRTLEWAQKSAAQPGADTAKIARNLEQQLRNDAPAVVPILEKLSGPRSMAAATWLGVLIALVSLLIGVTQSVSPEEIQEIVEKTIEQYEQNPTSPPAATPEEPQPAPAPEGPTLEA